MNRPTAFVFGCSIALALCTALFSDNQRAAPTVPSLAVSPWNTSRIIGSPEPPSPFVAPKSLRRLRFDRPLHIEIGPDGTRWFICQENGQIFSVPANDPDVRSADLFLDIRKKDPADPSAGADRRIWSIAFHPKFSDNGHLYVCFLEYKPQPNRNCIVRYTIPPERRHASPPVCDPATASLICEWPAGVDHFGGCLAFGRDGMLYFSAGDGHGYGDGDETGQRIDDLNASIMRIDVDHPQDKRAYGIPPDNPFVKTPNARPEVWAYGLRNVWKFSIDKSPDAVDPVRGDLWAGDVGQDLWEPVVLVARGGNYGWSIKEGTHDFRPLRTPGPTPILPPIFEHEHSEARSLTGGFVYRGNRFQELSGRYIYGDYETGKVWALKWNGTKLLEHRELLDTPLKLVGFGQDHTGEIVLLDYQGTLHRLERNPSASRPDASSQFPRKLSQTGLFQSTSDHLMAEGVVPYDVNSPLWSDGAYKHRYLALPPGKKIGYAPQEVWNFPKGSVLVKTFEMELEAGTPTSRKRLETRLLHLEEGHWRGYTYIWNGQQTDADLLEEPRGRDQTLTIRDAAAPGGQREQVWHYPGRAECTLCHTMPSKFVLGLKTAQLNRDMQYAGGRDNQLRAMEQAGLFDQPILPKHGLSGDAGKDPAAYTRLPKMPDPADPAANLNDRARSYLDANCSHCHRKWGGGNALFELTYQLPLDQTRTIDVPPQHGDHQIAGGKLIVPGRAEQSLVPWRMKQLGPHRMPRVGSHVIDAKGVQLINRWIDEMRR